MAKHDRLEKLVTASWLDAFLGPQLAKLCEGEASDPGCVVVEVLFEDAPPGSQNPECVPGAVSVHPSYFEAGLDSTKYYPHYTCPQDGNLLPDSQLHQAIADLGITEDTMVVVYGKGICIPMSSCRALWALMYAGVKDVRLLNGGFDAWRRYGGRLAAQPRVPTRVPQFNSTGLCVREYLASTAEVEAIASRCNSLTSPSPSPCSAVPGVLVDIRKLGEFDGSFADNYHFFTKSGHIPTAVYQGNWDVLVNLEESTLRDLDEVQSRWETLDLTADRAPLIFYCGTGWRSTIGFFLAFLMGMDAKNYDDSFYGWTWSDNVVHTTASESQNPKPETCTE